MLVNYIKRNIPVFIVGLVILAVVIWAIVADENTTPSILPNLIKVTQEPESPIEEETNPTITAQPVPVVRTTPSSIATTTRNIDQTSEEYLLEVAKDPAKLESIKLTQEQVDEKYGTLEIIYTIENGFKPRNGVGYLHQSVSITNQTDNRLIIKQTTPLFANWNTNKILEPQETIEFRFDKKGIWTFEDVENLDYGSVFIKQGYDLEPK